MSDVKAGSVRVDLLAKLGKWLKDFDKADKSLSKLENQTERSSRTFKHTSNTMLKLGQATRSAQARLQKMNRTMRDGERVAEKFDKRYGLVLDRMQSVGRSVGIAGGIITALAVGAIAKASKESDILRASLLGLTAVAGFKLGEDAIPKATQAARELASDGLMSVSESAKGLKNLLLSGVGLKEAVEMMKAFKNSAAFGKQGSLSFGEAVVGATEGIKNQNSILVDNSGITKNLSIMQKEYAESIGTTIGKLTDAQKAQAHYLGVLKEAMPMEGNAAKLTEELAGQKAKLNAQVKRLWQNLGTGLEPALLAVTKKMASAVEWTAAWIKENEGLSASLLLISTGIGSVTLVAAGLLYVIPGIVRGLVMLSPAIFAVGSGLKALIPLLAKTTTGNVMLMNGMGSTTAAITTTTITLKSAAIAMAALAAEAALIGIAVAGLTAIVWTGVDAWNAWQEVSKAQDESYTSVGKNIDRLKMKIWDLKKTGIIDQSKFLDLREKIRLLEKFNEYIDKPGQLYKAMGRGHGKEYEDIVAAMSAAGVSNVDDYIESLEDRYHSMILGISSELQNLSKVQAKVIEQDGTSIAQNIADTLVGGLTNSTSKVFNAFSGMIKDLEDINKHDTGKSRFDAEESQRSILNKGAGAAGSALKKPAGYIAALAKQLELADQLAQREQRITIASLDGYDQRRVAASMYYDELESRINSNISNEAIRAQALAELERVRLQELTDITAEQTAATEGNRREQLTDTQQYQLQLINGAGDVFASGLAAMLSGQESLAKGFKNLWKGMIDFAIAEISRLIVKMLIINTLKAAFHIPLSDGGVATNGGISRLPTSGGYLSAANGAVAGAGAGSAIPAVIHPPEAIIPLDKYDALISPKGSGFAGGGSTENHYHTNHITLGDVSVRNDQDMAELLDVLGAGMQGGGY